MLVGAIQLIKADGKEPDRGHQAMFMEELEKAQLLAPVDIMADTDSEGKKIINEKAKVRFPVLTAPDGKRFFVVFTDTATVISQREKEDNPQVPGIYKQDTVVVRFNQMAQMLISKGPNGEDNGIFGIMINPFVESIVIPKASAELAMQNRGKE